jgi:hypothetical protein
MSKTGGLGDNFYIGGYDISGDVGSVDQLGGGPALGDVTGIKSLGHEQVGLIRDADWQFTTYFNPSSAVDAEHTILSTLPRTDTVAQYFRGAAVLSPSACLNSKQVNYDPTRGTDASLTFKAELMANGFGMEWGEQLTPGKRTDTTATAGAAIDESAAFATPSIPSSTTPVTNTSPLPATVVITGGTMTNVSVGGVTVGTGAGTYTVPSGVAISMTYSAAPTWTWSLATAFGAQAYVQLFALTGTSVTIAVQHATTLGGSYSNITGLATSALTAAHTGVRLATAAGVTINPFLKVTTTGTFTNAVFAVTLVRNLQAVNF